jgi:hypothetical protein
VCSKLAPGTRCLGSIPHSHKKNGVGVTGNLTKDELERGRILFHCGCDQGECGNRRVTGGAFGEGIEANIRELYRLPVGAALLDHLIHRLTGLDIPLE